MLCLLGPYVPYRKFPEGSNSTCDCQFPKHFHILYIYQELFSTTGWELLTSHQQGFC